MRHDDVTHVCSAGVGGKNAHFITFLVTEPFKMQARSTRQLPDHYVLISGTKFETRKEKIGDLRAREAEAVVPPVAAASRMLARKLQAQQPTLSKSYLALQQMRAGTTLTALELASALSEAGVPLSATEAEALFASWDIDHDGQITFADFAASVERDAAGMAPGLAAASARSLLTRAAAAPPSMSMLAGRGSDLRPTFSDPTQPEAALALIR